MLRPAPSPAGGAAAASALPHGTLQLTISSCGQSWGTDAGASGSSKGVAAGGARTFHFYNGNTGDVEVQLQDVDTKKVFLEVDGVGVGATATGSVVLGKGDYRLVCYPADADPVAGPVVKVGAAPKGAQLTPGIVPVTTNDLIPVAKAYGQWVDGRLPALQAQVRQLNADVARGDLTAAKRDWLTAHLSYEGLGAAYGAFGDHDTAINGTPAAGKTALTDPALTGFHKIEALLWSGSPAAQLAPYTTKLVGAVDALAKDPGTDRIDPIDIGLRAHEIVENAIQFELTGATDAGSHTNLATIDANLGGSAEALSVLTGLLTSRYDDLAETRAALAASTKLVEGYRRADGSWVPLESLSRSQRQQLNASLDRLVELLAPVAEITEPRKALQ
ncbi:EfeM/EfeO family lipoprotein [Gryllotalpicola daejeonensis]|uniref:EfeM/EfeO family lipoprotein n=2 Tax=Gryllotalpicola daejeonensis TaxID=993087 RepID=A0ABP7ZLL6_9MICO